MLSGMLMGKLVPLPLGTPVPFHEALILPVSISKHQLEEYSRKSKTWNTKQGIG